MNIHFIKSSEKRRIVEKLKEQFGIGDLPYLLIESGKEKIRAFTGSLSKEEISKISQIANVEVLGLYLLKRENEGFRLGLDASIVLSKQISKNVVEIDEQQCQKWIRGQDLEIKVPRGTYIIKYKDDFLGCGKSNEEKLFNYIPKDRRLKK